MNIFLVFMEFSETEVAFRTSPDTFMKTGNTGIEPATFQLGDHLLISRLVLVRLVPRFLRPQPCPGPGTDPSSPLAAGTGFVVCSGAVWSEKTFHHPRLWMSDQFVYKKKQTYTQEKCLVKNLNGSGLNQIKLYGLRTLRL